MRKALIEELNTRIRRELEPQTRTAYIEIGELRIHRGTVYYLAEHYLPENYLNRVTIYGGIWATDTLLLAAGDEHIAWALKVLRNHRALDDLANA